MLIAGDRIRDWTLVAPLGAGGFGMVWLARDDAGREVAIKVLHANLLSYQGTDKGPSVAERFLNEARIIQNLDYPGFVRIYDVIDEPERMCVAYVMERLKGRDLTKVIKTIALPTLLEVIAQAAETLGLLHEQGIIHRDVKGSNIFVCDPESGESAYKVKLIDFGIAKELHAEAMMESTATGYFLGTVRSMAPECFHRWTDTDAGGLTGAVDQWSLGVTLFYFLSGRMPFDDDSLVRVISAIEQGPPKKIRMLSRFGMAEPPLDLTRIMDRCMAINPTDRYPTMTLLARSLRNVAARMSSSSTDATAFDPELARTAIDSRTPEGSQLAEAQKIARALKRARTEIDGFGPTAQTDAGEIIATELDHPVVRPTTAGTAPDTKARPATAPTAAVISATVAAKPSSIIANELTKAPKPLTGPLIVGDLSDTVPSGSSISTLEEANGDSDSGDLEGAYDETLIRSGPSDVAIDNTRPQAPAAGQRDATRPALPPRASSGGGATRLAMPPAGPAKGGKMTPVLVALIGLALGLVIYLVMYFRR